jgi:hypothetical protein
MLINKNDKSMKYEIVISFASEERNIAEVINSGLKDAGVKTFYDKDHKIDLWGKNLTELLQEIYSKESKYCLMIVSQNYLGKMWTRHERRAALSRMIEKSDEYILPYIVDETSLNQVEGLNPNTAYIKSTDIQPTELIELILAKLGKHDIPKKDASTGIIQLRSQVNPRLRTDEIVQVAINNNFTIVNEGIFGDFQHKYKVKTVDDTKVVVDYATGLMWWMSPNILYISRPAASEFIRSINDRDKAEFSDWHLPTLEELISLIEPVRKAGGNYIDRAFELGGKNYIWSADSAGTDAGWGVHFEYGSINLYTFSSPNYILPVRSSA